MSEVFAVIARIRAAPGKGDASKHSSSSRLA